MKRASYRDAVEWIALNDNAGEDLPGNPDAEDNAAHYISSALVADLFGIEQTKVGADVMAYRAEFAEKGERTGLTVAMVNKVLKDGGAAERLFRGKDYYYFAEGNASMWPSTMVYVNRVDALTLEQWIREWKTLRADAPSTVSA